MANRYGWKNLCEANSEPTERMNSFSLVYDAALRLTCFVHIITTINYFVSRLPIFLIQGLTSAGKNVVTARTIKSGGSTIAQAPCSITARMLGILEPIKVNTAADGSIPKWVVHQNVTKGIFVAPAP